MILLFAAVVCVAALLITFGVQASQRAKLQEELLRGWSRVEQDDDTYYELELDFSEDSVDYNFHSKFAWLDTTIITLEYKVISGNRIKILDYDKEFQIEFNEDRTCFKVTPSLTNSDAYEFWYHFD